MNWTVSRFLSLNFAFFSWFFNLCDKNTETDRKESDQKNFFETKSDFKRVAKKNLYVEEIHKCKAHVQI